MAAGESASLGTSERIFSIHRSFRMDFGGCHGKGILIGAANSN